MSISIVNNLYPPLINTYMPSFDINDTIPLPEEEAEKGKTKEVKPCRVYFALSDFNSLNDISTAGVQVVVNDRNSNRSVLNPELYPGEIKITELYEDKTIEGKYRYYIEIDYNDLVNGFEINKYYKVQIRFTAKNVPLFEDSGLGISVWLVENQQYFSEWSSVCLIRGIETPIVTIRGFEDHETNRETAVTTESIQFAGNVEFTNPGNESAEYLDKAYVRVYQKELGELSAEEHEIQIQQNIAESKGEFNYVHKEFIEENISYVIKFTFITSGGYTDSREFNFKLLRYGVEDIAATINAFPDNEEGRIRVEIKSLENESFMGKFTIRRSSSESNFKVWEDIHNAISFNDEALDYIWYDYTAKSGVWYKYCIQKRLGYTGRGAIVQMEEPVMPYYEDLFLVHGGRQLKLKYDPSISSFKYNILESKTDTLGSIFPFINRNASTRYRTIPLTGLITSFCDEAGLFTTKESIYGENLVLYEKYNDNNDINKYKDFSYEREFRERVIDFLYEDNVKLLKSPTEGNILVRIMEVNFTPNQTLGRMLYSFSATAHEIDEATVDNYKKYNIQEFSSISENLLQKKDTVLGKVSFIEVETINENGEKVTQLAVKDIFSDNANGTPVPVDGNIVGTVNTVNEFNKEIGFNSTIAGLNQTTLLFTSKPYTFQVTKENGEDKIDFFDPETSEIKEGSTIINGYWIKVNDEDILIVANPPQYYNDLVSYSTKYEINGLSIDNLSLCHPASVEIDYVADRIQEEDVSKMVSKLYYEKKIGQIQKVFKPNESIVKDLQAKYNETHEGGYSELLSVIGLSAEAPQGAVLVVKDSLDTKHNEHDISALGFLDLENIYTTIKDFYFGGIRLVPANYRENYMELTDDKTEFLYDYESFFNEGQMIRNTEYLNMYNAYEEVNGKIIVTTKIVDKLPNYPFENSVYAIKEDGKVNYKIYYNQVWYPFDIEQEIVRCPISALVNYYCDVVEGEY